MRQSDDFNKQMINDMRVYAGQKDRALKLDAGISGNYTFISYEQAINPSPQGKLVFTYWAGFGNQNGWNAETQAALISGTNSNVARPSTCSACV